MTGVQLGEVFEYVNHARNDEREGVCQWIVDNMNFARGLIPRTYPHVIQYDSENEALCAAAYAIGAIATATVLGTIASIYWKREEPVMKFAQVEFLWILLAGLLLVSVGAIILAAPPPDPLCVSTVWLVNVGYTLELFRVVFAIS
jgi:hypothetical protein